MMRALAKSMVGALLICYDCHTVNIIGKTCKSPWLVTVTFIFKLLLTVIFFLFDSSTSFWTFLIRVASILCRPKIVNLPGVPLRYIYFAH